MKKNLAYYCEQINCDDNWAQSYKHFVPLFIQEAKTKTRWEDWDKDVFWEFFERPNDQCVSSLQQGYFSRDERSDLKNHWDEIYPLLKIIADNQDVPQWNVYDRLSNVIRQYTKKNMRAATCRLAAALQPHLLCTIVDDGTIENRLGSRGFDSEGTPTNANVLIKDGILCGFMYDKLNAKLMGQTMADFALVRNPVTGKMEKVPLNHVSQNLYFPQRELE